jgi:DNA mismatch repair protein MutS2
MDSKSIHTLEFDKIRELVAGYASFSAGEALVRSLHPTADLEEARQWQSETREAILLLDTHSDVTIGGARDVRDSVENALRGFTLQAEALLDIRATIIAARNIRRQLIKAADDFPHLADIGELIERCPGIVSAVSSTIDERGEVLDSASAKLAKIRQEQRVVHGRIQDKLQKILGGKLNHYLQEPIITTRSGRYVLPLRADARGRIKGIVHDHSGSGATLWIEPIGTVELNNQYRGLQLQEQEEIERLLAELSGKVADQGESIKRVVERLAELDLIFARARYASITHAVEPQFLDWRSFPTPRPPKHANELAKWTPPPPDLHPGSIVWIKGARHPLLDPEEVVPTDLTLDEDTFVVLITGPNTGGKTVSLKTTGLMVLMAQTGLHVPAIEARLTAFENVFADIGDEQSIEQSLSTFSAHMSNIVRILARVDDRSLVLLDELGSGTDPTEGAALAQAIVSLLRDKGATTFVATHYPELKLYASQVEGATNASLLFDVGTLSPTFEMTIGLPGRSNAFAIARRLGLDETVLDEAMRLVGVGSNEAESVLDSIYELREKIESEEAGTRMALRQAEEERDVFQRRLEMIEEERLAILDEARRQAEQEIEAVRDEIKRVRRKVREAASLNQLKKASKELDEVAEAKITPPVASPAVAAPARKRRPSLNVGDSVRVTTLNVKGVIASIAKKEAVVAVGRLHMRAQLSDLEFTAKSSEEEPEPGPMMRATPSPGIELDLRGRRVEEGLATLGCAGPCGKTNMWRRGRKEGTEKGELGLPWRNWSTTSRGERKEHPNRESGERQSNDAASEEIAWN